MEYLESYGMDTKGPRALARVLASSLRPRKSSRRILSYHIILYCMISKDITLQYSLIVPLLYAI